MSIAALNWAWHQILKPVPKLVLMALADAADDQGVCWPSVATIAVKVGVSTRTVRRVIQMLIRHELLTAEQRHRSDGSCSSNRYRLSLGGGDNLSPGPDRGDTTPGHASQCPPDDGVIPGTTIGTIKESSQLHLSKTDPEDRGGKLFDLSYSKDLMPVERSQAEVLIKALAALLNQQVLDEWAKSLGLCSPLIRSSPIRLHHCTPWWPGLLLSYSIPPGFVAE
ncbi:MAG: helix-turn-helix domain-containing protein, partial [Pseudomonadota bacterium]|nr:helix-turn-helix domain-containing protein [Pseudomonadota bacterium]